MLKGEFTHLHTHSHYSLLDGLGKIPDILDRAVELEMDSIALTDHGTMYGSVEFYQEAKKRGVKPIIGVEAYLAPNGRDKKRGKMDGNPRHLTLLAQNNEGYKNLIGLTTTAHLEGYYYKPRIDYEVLEKHSSGVIVLSGCMNGDISKAILEKRLDDAERLIEWHLEVFGKERFFLEVQHHPNIEEQGLLNEQLWKYAKKYNLDVTATSDAHYIRPEDAEAQDVLVCVQTGKTVQDKDRLCMLGEDFSIRGPQDMKEYWSDHPEAVDTTMKIAEMCNVELEFGVNRLPRIPLPKGMTADEMLRSECEKGLVARYGDNLPEDAHTRLDYELDVIKSTGYASYFLIVSDFVNEAKRRDILVGPGRGSAAGSLVSYLTNITNVDPLHYNLLFERFLNPERVSMPDIDLDFADDRRDEIIDYVREKYGRDYVAQIITFGTMAARAAVRDAGRALGLPYAFCDTVAKLIPPFTDFEGALVNGSELKQMYDQDPQAKKLVDTARKLEGVCRHASTHAAGVVIGDKPLTEYVPLQYSTTGGESQSTVTQYAMGPVEALGLLKMDFLGLKNLTIIKRALKIIKARHDVDIDPDALPLDDVKSYELLQQGLTTGVFQLESSGMKRYLKELKPTEFEDIISMVALYRPGPMDSIPDFIAAKHGKKKISYLHPLLKPILEKTYGIIVTQDQVLQIAREFAGFSYAEADILRKAVGKKIKELLDEQRKKFIDGAVNVKRIDGKTAEAVWDFIEPFARYGFNRAHAACYAMIAYQTAYLKANYPAEFMAALLTSDEGNTDRQAIEVAEAISMDIPVLPPDINESMRNFTVVDADGDSAAIRFGLGAIKNVGTNAIEAIISSRSENGKFVELLDVFRRVPPREMNRKSVEALAKSGAFDTLSERKLVLENVDTLLDFSRALHKQRDAGQQNLFGGGDVELAEPTVSLAEVAPAEKDERLTWEKELLGLYVSEHPLSEVQQDLGNVAVPLNELTLEFARRVGQKPQRVAGVISRITKIITKSQKPMLFVQVEDMVGKTEILVFPGVLEKTASFWEDGQSVIVEGKLSDKDGEVKVLADSVWSLTKETLDELVKTSPRRAKNQFEGSMEYASSLLLQIPRGFSREQLEKLKQALASHHTPEGELPVQLLVPKNGNTFTLDTPYRLQRNEDISNELSAILGKQSVRFS